MNYTEIHAFEIFKIKILPSWSVIKIFTEEKILKDTCP
jgi:hypothetical protein